MKKTKRLLMTLLALTVLATGSGCAVEPTYSRYRSDFMDTFDTVVTVMAYAQSDAQFDEILAIAHDEFLKMHKLFDIYHNYDGINNIKTINDNAGIKPVMVDPHIIEMIKLSKEWYRKTGGAVNIAMGSVLSIWHNYREAGIDDPGHAQLPPMSGLKAADAHTDIDRVIVDEKSSTVYLENKEMSLDVGAVAKGYATEVVADLLTDKGFDSVLISAGGNVRAIGMPKDGVRSKWSVGIKDPDSPLQGSTDEENLLDVAYVTNISVVSSGSYERFYVVDGKAWHHLIDPSTLMPADYYKAVTVVTEDSAEADILSTALFLMPPDESLAFAQDMGVEALWVMPDNELVYTPGMKVLLRDLGGAYYK